MGKEKEMETLIGVARDVYCPTASFRTLGTAAIGANWKDFRGNQNRQTRSPTVGKR